MLSKNKISVLFIYLVSSMFIVVNGQVNVVSPSDSTKWELTFSDEFNDDHLDLDVWRTAKGMTRDFEFVHQKNWLTKNNIVLEDGLLKLYAKREDVTGSFVTDWSTSPDTKKTADFKYTSAEISTKKQYGYGKFEIRCKIPKGKGYWPAFWMYGETDGDKINNEIDVFEFWHPKNGLRKYIPRFLSRIHHMTIHHNGKMSHVKYKGQDFSEEFHVFTVVYTPDYIEWYVDGELKRRYDSMKGEEVKGLFKKMKSKNRGDVFPDIKMDIIVNVAIQSNKKAPDEDTIFPQSLEVDYIRYYKLLSQ